MNPTFPPFAPETSLPEMLNQSERRATGHLLVDCPARELVEKSGRHVKPCQPCLDAYRQAAAKDREIQARFDAAWLAQYRPDVENVEQLLNEKPARPMPEPMAEGVPAATRTEARVSARPGVKPPSAKQMDLLKRLFAERKGLEPVDAMRTRLLGRHRDGTLSRGDASDAITQLLKVPANDRSDRAAAGPPSPTRFADVPAGHYAIGSTGANDLAFYRVDRPTSGEYAGRVYVKQVVGGKPDQNVPFKQLAGILARIDGDTYDRPANPELGIDAGLFTGPDGAAKRYADEIGRCTRCNRRLTDKTSRSLAIGPECRNKAA